jgi:nucleotide-binding universal stress UspA family protein
MYKNILVPFDFGNSFTNVPDELVKLTRGKEEAKVTIFNVIPENEMADNVKFQGKHFDDITKERIEDMDFFRKELDQRPLNYELKFKSGPVIASLKEEIDNGNYDVVVMSNKRSRMQIKHVLGHVTHKIAKRVNIPVIIIK